MAQILTETGTLSRETKIDVFQGVQVHHRKDAQGQFTGLDAIDEDERKICQIADRLQRHGYGVILRGTTVPDAFITPARRAGPAPVFLRTILSTRSR